MKKIFLVIIAIFILTGCNKVTPEEEKYNEYLTYIKETDDNITDLPFDLEIYVDKIIDTEIMYRVIIDNPKISLRNIQAMVIHDNYTGDVFPSSGIFESSFSLIPNLINKSSNYVEGIILAGYIPFDKDISEFSGTFKLLFKYSDDDEKEHTIIYSTKK